MLTLFLWAAGIRMFYNEILAGGGLEELLAMLREGGLAVSVILVLMLGWTYYNYLWFLRRGERRNKFESLVFDTQIADHFSVDLAVLKQYKQANRIEVFIDGKQIQLSKAEKVQLSQTEPPFRDTH